MTADTPARVSATELAVFNSQASDPLQIEDRIGLDLRDSRALTQVQAERIADYEAVLADKRRLAREIDVAMHGEEGAAKQASLCDLVEPARMMRERIAALEADIAAVRTNRDALARGEAAALQLMAIEKRRAEAAESSLAETRAKVDAMKPFREIAHAAWHALDDSAERADGTVILPANSMPDLYAALDLLDHADIHCSSQWEATAALPETKPAAQAEGE